MIALLLVFLLVPAHAHEGLRAQEEHADAQVRQAPEDAAAWVARADVRRRAGEPAAALADLDRAQALDPALGDLWLVRAEVCRDLGDWPAALAALDRVLAGGAHADALALRAEVLAASGRRLEALEAWDVAIALSPTPDRVLARGRLAESLGDLDRAARGYAEGVAALGAVSLRLARVDVERRRGRPEAARDQVDALLGTAPDHPEWLLLRADCVAEAGGDPRPDRERALAALDRQIALRPTPARYEARAQTLALLETP